MRSYRKRSSITLLEIMIVILLIGLIGGVLSYNLKGTLDRGKAFRSEEGIKRLKDILEIACEQDDQLMNKLSQNNNIKIVEKCIKDSGFVPQGKEKDFLLDGWKEPYIVSVTNEGNILISSPRLKQYQDRNEPSSKKR